MAATAWAFYNQFKEYISGDIDLDADEFRMALYQSSSNAATDTLSTQNQVTNEVTATNGYVAGGQTLTGVNWSQGASAGVLRFDCNNPIWTATGGAINNVKFAVIYREAGTSAGADKLVCTSTLTSSEFDLSSGNTLTVTINASGVFELT